MASDDAQQPNTTPNPAPRVDAATVNGAPTPEHHGQTIPLLKSAPVASSMDSLSAAPPPVPATPATKALEFISTATPSTLAGIAVVFSGITYAILGKVGLLFIGAFGGVVAFVSLEARNPNIARAVRGEKGPEILDRVWLDLQGAKSQDCADSKDEETTFKAFDDFRPDTREALSGLVDAVIRDYVKWWYSPIIPTDHSFPLACRKTLNSYLFSISNRMSRKRPADAFLDLLTNCSSIVIVLMSELAAAFADLSPDSNMTAADAVYNYLASNPNSRLANLLDQRQQAAKFKMVAEDLLGFLDQSSQNCDPARIFLREILANSVLEMTLQTCSKAEWINGWIVHLLEAGEPDINQAIDVGMQTGRDSGTNVFADMDGNVGNIGIAKPSRPSAEVERGRRKESLGHRKKLSKADEKLEEAMEEMKRMNEMIAKGDAHHNRASTSTDSAVYPDQTSEEVVAIESDVSKRKSATLQESPEPRQSFDKSSLQDMSAGEFYSNSEVENTPITPRSIRRSSSRNASPQGSSEQQFTSFDQIVPQAQDDGTEDDPPKKAPLTLHNASFTLHDDSTGDGSKIRNKPNWDYLIQVEPSSSAYPGWMIVRRYSDFQTLHEILRRIAAISGATAFTELHKELPSWKIHTRESLRGELERYLRDGCWYQSLAECEGMKRFLEKSQGHTHGNSKSFGWETVGKNMLDVLTIAPKGAMESGKTLVGGVSGVFGNFSGLNRRSTNQSVDLTLTPSSSRLSISGPSPVASARSPARSDRASMDSQRSSVVSTQPGRVPPMGRRPSYQALGDGEGENGRVGRSERMEPGSASASARPSREHSRASSLAAIRSPSTVSLDFSKLPPPPDEISDDYEASAIGDEAGPKANETAAAHHIRRSSTQSTTNSTAAAVPATNGVKKVVAKPVKQYSQLSEQETRVAVELLFAIINEMYTLSSAWNIRRTLLAAAKSFLLRPGNPSLLTVQSLIQSSVLDANASDAGIAASLRKLRENTMPTDQERASWPAEMTADEKEKLAVKARRLLIQSGVPAALMGVMGQAATGEALGRVFDCLQIEEVARGLIFGLLLQAVRIVTH